jgi:hypothetical protein
LKARQRLCTINSAPNASVASTPRIVWIENPDPPMPRLYPSPLDEREVQDVAAFVQRIR